MRFRDLLQILLRSALILISIAGIVLTVTGGGVFMASASGFMFFTIQSNIAIILITAVFLWDTIRRVAGKGSFITQKWRMVKYLCTVAVTITFLVFAFMLAPMLGKEYLFSFMNYSVHFIVPILAILDFLLFDEEIRLNARNFLAGLLFPLYYVCFFLIGIPLGFRYGGATAPYFFLDYETLGWFSTGDRLGVVFWILLFVVGISLLCAVFWGLMRLRQHLGRKARTDRSVRE